MGCDVHAFIDYETQWDDGSTHAYNLAKVKIGRNYWLFSLLAGARYESIQGQSPIAPRKGLPALLSYEAKREAYLYVVDHPTDTPGECTKEEALQWGNKYVDEYYVEHPDWHSHTWLTLKEVRKVIQRYKRLKESVVKWIKAREKIPEGYVVKHKTKNGKLIEIVQPVVVPPEMLAIQAMMSAMEKAGTPCRLLLWFDN